MKKRILFVCIGNAVRSQMAEGLARVYGWDCVAPASAGLAPASRIDPVMTQLMSDIGIDVSEAFPKHYQAITRLEFDLIVNISGHPLPGAAPKAPVIEWSVDDPVGQSPEQYRAARDLIQKLTLGLVSEIRQRKPERAGAPAAARASEGGKSASGPMLLDRKRRLRQSS